METQTLTRPAGCLILSRHKLEEQANLVETDLWLRTEFADGQTSQVDIAFLLDLNQRLLRNVRRDSGEPLISGTFRKTRVEVRTSQGTHHPPDPEKVPLMLDSHLRWLEGLRAREVPAATRAMHLAVAVCAIHPFMEGNGRTARMGSLATFLLDGYRYARRGIWEEFFEEQRKRWTDGMWLAVRGNPGTLSALFMEAASTVMRRSPNLRYLTAYPPEKNPENFR